MASEETSDESTDSGDWMPASREECAYASCYCEENVWRMCRKIDKRRRGNSSSVFAVIVSNASKSVILWRQRSAKRPPPEDYVIWDYHVFAVCDAVVLDLDSTLPFACPVKRYVAETFGPQSRLKQELRATLRVVPASDYLARFHSDRTHMLRPDGTWLRPPPSWPAIEHGDVDIRRWWSQESGDVPGQLESPRTFARRFG